MAADGIVILGRESGVVGTVDAEARPPHDAAVERHVLSDEFRDDRSVAGGQGPNEPRETGDECWVVHRL